MGVKRLNLSWSQFEVCNQSTQTAFEKMCRLLFNRFFFDNRAIFHSNPNNPGVEVEPILDPKSNKHISFQAKFLSSTDYKQIMQSAKKAASYYFIKHFDFKAYAVVLDKKNVDSSEILKSNISVYNHTIRELLLRVSMSNQIVVIDGKATKSHAVKLRICLRQSLKENGIDNTRFWFVDPRKDSIIQLADIIAERLPVHIKIKPTPKDILIC